MATVVSITNPITGAVEQVDKLDHTAQQIDDAVALAPQLSNPNLLDNWYFGNPVNQRGQTEYTGDNIYTIDRWLLSQATGTLTVESGQITYTADTATVQLRQYIDVQLPDGYYTLSFLLPDKSIYYKTLKKSGNSYSHVKEYGSLGVTSAGAGAQVSSNNNRDTVFVYTPAGASLSLVAAKFEFGSRQTLAHQDADGNWVLNGIPDYGEQLRRCQRYFVRLNGIAPLSVGYAYDSGSVLSVIFLPVAMRTNPAITLHGAVNYRFSASANYQSTNLLNYGFSGFSIQLFSNSFINSPTLTAGKPCDVYLVEGNSIDISADL